MNVRITNQLEDLVPVASTYVKATITDDVKYLVTDGVNAGVIDALNEKTTVVNLVVEGAPVRVRSDGGDPDDVAETGFPVEAGRAYPMSRHEARKMRLIRQGATDGTIHVQEYKRP